MQSSLRTLSVITVTYISFALCMSLETNSIRSIIHQHKQNDTQQQNITQNNNVPVLLDNILDVRTPPKVQSQIKDKLSSKYALESSHAGVAIPVLHDLMEDGILEESSTKKTNYYKLERPTTPTAGLSTWILLNSPATVTSSVKPLPTKKSNIKPIIIKDDKNNETLMLSDHDKPSIKMAKPVFKPRSTTPKPVIITNIITTAVTTTTAKINSFSPSSSSTRKPPAKLTKVKASLLQNYNNSRLKNNTTISITTTTNAPKVITTNAPKISTTTTTPKMILINTTEPSNAALSAEAKITEQELPASSEHSKKKKKKNKKKRKPSKSKEGNQKLKEASSSPGTELYSYFRSEIIPVTVGVSLVGLLVTAGLAGYYFTPFAALRRSDPIIDRKDTEGSYYYQHHDTYSNAMPEEEALDKFIAGMPSNSGNNLQQPLSNRNPQNVRYRHVDRRSQIYMNPHGSVEDVKLNDRTAVNYNYDKKFVVGSIPEETIQEITPAVVPEHGPRNLQENRRKFVVGNIPVDLFSRGASPRKMALRKKRAIPINYEENEISPEYSGVKNIEESTITSSEETTLTTDLTTTEETHSKETTPTNNISERPHNNTVIDLLTDLFKLKLKLSLDLFRNFTSTVSNYVRTVHTRLNEHYRRSVNKKDQA